MSKLTFNFKGQDITIDVPDLENKKPSNKGWELSYKTADNGISDFADMTDHYKKLFIKYEPRVTSKNLTFRNKSAVEFKKICDGVAGRPLEAQELKTIILHCQRKNPKMKINKYGHLFGRRIPAKLRGELFYKGRI